MKLFFILFLIPAQIIPCNAQQYIIKSIKDFGAKGDGYTNDQDAFAKASSFFNNRKGKGKLIIPKGTYIVGRQKFLGNEKGSQRAYDGEYALNLVNCENMVIVGQRGAVIKNSDSLRIGTFYPKTGKPFKHSIPGINIQPEYANYACNAGIILYANGCSHINISGLIFDGNVENFIFGGNWGSGRNAFELIHYGVYLLDSHDIFLNNCSIKNFSCDGIYIANLGQQLKTFNINIDQCKVNFCGRNALSWLGGENIRVTNSLFSGSGQGIVHESPAAGIDIEVENNSFCRKGYFYNCIIENNIGSAIASGSKALSSEILFKKCIAASPVYYTVFADAASHVFEDCSFYGTVLVWYSAKTEKEGIKFKHCLFDENYQGKKMYDGAYQLGIEATSVEVESCRFLSYTTSNYYLNALTKDCSKDNTQKIKVSNSIFYNEGKEAFKLANKIAGIAHYTVFFNNKFFSRPGVSFLNGFEAKCNADAGGNKFYQITGK